MESRLSRPLFPETTIELLQGAGVSRTFWCKLKGVINFVTFIFLDLPRMISWRRLWGIQTGVHLVHEQTTFALLEWVAVLPTPKELPALQLWIKVG